MTQREDLRDEYRDILRAYLGGAGEAAVMRAYDFTRKCMREGLAPDDVIAFHLELLEELKAPADEAQSLLLEMIMAFSINYRQAVEELERANQELERVSRFKSRMLSMVAHDLTNHSTAVRLFTQIMLRDTTDEKMKEHLQQVLEVLEDQQDLLGNLLDLGRLENGRLDLNLRPVELMKIVGRTVDKCSRTTTKHKLSVAGPPSIEVMADRAKLQQIVENLVTNAIKYSPAGGPVDVSVSANAGRVTVEVKDRGLGIPPEDLPHIFEPFFRAAGLRGTGIGGSGLGLAIARSLLQMMGGDIEVESTHGQGSTFRFRIPEVRVHAGHAT